MSMAVRTPGPTLETERLLLRPPQLEDFDAWAAFVADGEHVRFIGGPQVRGVAWRGLMSVIGAWSAYGFAFFSVIEKDSGRWIGRVGPWRPEDWPGNEVGWGIVADAGGKGYATEAAAAAIDWTFDHLQWDEVIHIIDADNLASKRVAHRVASRYLRPIVLSEPHQDKRVEVWGQRRDDWHSRRGCSP